MTGTVTPDRARNAVLSPISLAEGELFSRDCTGELSRLRRLYAEDGAALDFFLYVRDTVHAGFVASFALNESGTKERLQQVVQATFGDF